MPLKYDLCSMVRNRSPFAFQTMAYVASTPRWGSPCLEHLHGLRGHTVGGPASGISLWIERVSTWISRSVPTNLTKCSSKRGPRMAGGLGRLSTIHRQWLQRKHGPAASFTFLRCNWSRFPGVKMKLNFLELLNAGKCQSWNSYQIYLKVTFILLSNATFQYWLLWKAGMGGKNPTQNMNEDA